MSTAGLLLSAYGLLFVGVVIGYAAGVFAERQKWQ